MKCLKKYRHEQLEKVVGTVTELLEPECIYLWSVMSSAVECENIFSAGVSTERAPDHYHLLIIMSGAEKCSDAMLEMIEAKCRQHVKVTAWMMPAPLFDRLLSSEHPFATQINQHALVCYGEERQPLSKFKITDSKSFIEEPADYLERATEFMAGVDLYFLRKQFGPASFLLHQAAEQFLCAIMIHFTGYHFKTHNLEKLFRYTQPLVEGISNVFCSKSESEQRLFRLLQRAYIDSRYSADFHVKEFELAFLKDKIHRLGAIAQDTIISRKAEKNNTKLQVHH
jgi:HEPN domain-containing protein